MSESLGVWTGNLIQPCTLPISRLNSKVKVVGQRSMSPGKKVIPMFVSVSQNEQVYLPDTCNRPFGSGIVRRRA